ncbi:MAG: heterodisulfide reductase-related iron-sulfur binding cluster [Sphingomonadaceae bacterium]
METREIYWNIQGIWIMYALFGLTLAVFGYGAYQHYRLLALGKAENRFDRPGERRTGVLLHGLAQIRSLRDRYSGVMHLLFFWGFAVLFLGTVVVFLQADLGLQIMHGPFYLYFQSLALDVLGLLAIVGVLMAIIKRHLLRPDRLLNPPRHRTLLDDGVVLGLILAILITGFVVEGIRIVATSDPWAAWSPVGLAVGSALTGLGFDVRSLQEAHRFLWWFHLLIAFAFIAYIPYSKLRHLVLSPANIYFRSLQPMGALKPIDIESAETLGTPKLEDLTWKQLLDCLACTECGRCQAACPAYSTGQPLSPKALILDLRNQLYRSRRPAAALSLARKSPPDAAREGMEECPTIAAVTPEALWSCVTCGSCMQQCPIFVEHVPTIVDLRRYLVMERAEYPELMQEALGSMEARGHPFRGTMASRTDWCEGLGVKIVGEAGPAEWLYWVGCAAAFDDRNQRVAKAFARLLQRAGVDFAILGEEEQCTGDVARRIGNEYLFQMMAQANVETLNRYGVKKIVTTCPHCFNTLKNEYPQFGGSFEVYHHTELLARLLKEGKLRPTAATVESVTFHDSCYLARYNGIADPPREILSAMDGLDLLEMPRSREETFCCGAGGGHLWFEEAEGKRINYARADQALALSPAAIASSCPFCMIMLSDGVKMRGGEREVPVLDVAELLEQATRPASSD